MSSIGYDTILLKLFILLLFHIARITWNFFQSLYWMINGISKQIQKSRESESGSNSIQVLDVVYQYRLDIFQRISRNDFVLRHKRFVSPDYILNTDHVTLLTLDEEGAIFVETLPGKEIWKSKYGACLRLAQMEHAIRLLYVPMRTFIRMTERLDTTRQSIVFLWSPARCGSTLLLQMMEMTERCVTIGESEALQVVSRWHHKSGSTAHIKTVSRACVQWLCRPYKNFQPDVYVVKIPSLSSPFIRLLTEICPSSKHVFIYRGVEKCSKSFCRLIQEFPLLKISNGLAKYSPSVIQKVLYELGYHELDFSIKLTNDGDWGFFMWCLACLQYLRLRKEGVKISAVRYEDLIGDRRHAGQALLNYCGLPTALTDNALRGLELDSQRNSLLSRSILSRHKVPVMSETERRRARKLLERLGLPNMDSDGILQGTLTWRV